MVFSEDGLTDPNSYLAYLEGELAFHNAAQVVRVLTAAGAQPWPYTPAARAQLRDAITADLQVADAPVLESWAQTFEMMATQADPSITMQERAELSAASACLYQRAWQRRGMVA